MNNPTKFTLTENHIKLLRRFWVEWDGGIGAGAPAINPKRPYGNSYVAGNIHEIVTGKSWSESISEEQEDQYLLLHRETETALQIILSTGSFVPGVYIRKAYSNKWQAV